MSWATGRWRWQASVRKGLALQTLIQFIFKATDHDLRMWINRSTSLNQSMNLNQIHSTSFYIILHSNTVECAESRDQVKGSGWEHMRALSDPKTTLSQEFKLNRTPVMSPGAAARADKCQSVRICPVTECLEIWCLHLKRRSQPERP